MKERPILFSGPMVRAILSARKTVTRRIVGSKIGVYATDGAPNVAESLVRRDADGDPCDGEVRCPYGVPGDRLWVRETFASDVPGCEEQGGYSYRADHQDPKGDGPANPMTWTPSIYMRRVASRVTLEVVDVRVERLHAITEQDAIAEGVSPSPFCRAGRPAGLEHVDAFEELWDELNAKRAPWADNPWVWRVEFRRVS